MKISKSDAIMDCSACKMRSKILPSPMHDSLATYCFDLIHSDAWGITPFFSFPL